MVRDWTGIVPSAVPFRVMFYHGKKKKTSRFLPDPLQSNHTTPHPIVVRTIPPLRKILVNHKNPEGHVFGSKAYRMWSRTHNDDIRKAKSPFLMFKCPNLILNNDSSNDLSNPLDQKGCIVLLAKRHFQISAPQRFPRRRLSYSNILCLGCARNFTSPQPPVVLGICFDFKDKSIMSRSS